MDPKPENVPLLELAQLISPQCKRCAKDNHISGVRKFPAENELDPGVFVPDQLKGLTQVEQMLIAKVATVVQVFSLKGGQRGYTGNVISFPQHVRGFVTNLPRNVRMLDIVIVRRTARDVEAYKDFHVRRDKILDALLWLRQNKRHYTDIQIDENNLAMLPQDGNVEALLPFINSTDGIADAVLVANGPAGGEGIWTVR
ncbi:hypothetical protein RvY_10725 [Ramazzottius varieornatus]|uniref:DUF6570 domain-containing protein n=1 Tax=Ramazzottius varieornatus TaxID=947166 RepID=A0A1D1VLI0_RAMVA|nr:hypothetical protein RvY_10725 [Ramazzottius varieornatus]